MNWNDHAKYYDWEFDLICTNQRNDVRIWKELAKEFGSPILEICCGSGRITEELISSLFIILETLYSTIKFIPIRRE